MMHLRLGGLEFVGDAADATYTIEADGIRGLKLDGVDVRREQVDRPAAHGAFSLPGYLTGRSITWSGSIETQTVDEQKHAIARLSGLLADGGSGRLVVEEGGESRWLDVVRAGEPDFKMRLYGVAADYSFEVWAADPRMFGEVREFAAGQVAYQYGNFPATPKFEVTGTSGGYTITGPSGKQFTVSSGPGSGTDRIDMSTGRVYRNGTLLVGAVTRGDLWTVPVGLPGVTHTITAGTLTVKVTDTFV